MSILEQMFIDLKNGAYRYSPDKLLGKGCFAMVYEGIVVENGRVVAVRLLNLNLLKEYGNKIKQIISTLSTNQDNEANVLRNIADVKDIRTNLLVKIYDCFLTEHNVTMIMEYCPNGNLSDVVKKKSKENFNENIALEIMYQMALALELIAENKIVHRDLKPDNIFLRKIGEHMLYKIGDFGFAVQKDKNTDTLGTPLFMSPQIVKEEPYGSQVDVWAYGLICYYLLFEVHYFMERSEESVRNKILNCPFKFTSNDLTLISPETADLISMCLKFNKNERIKSSELTSHKAFAKVRDSVQKKLQEVRTLSYQMELQMKFNTPKGQVINKIYSYKFLNNLALSLYNICHEGFASVYLLKFTIAQLYAFKQSLLKKENVINHPGWNGLVNGDGYQKISLLLNEVQKNVMSSFEAVSSKVFEKVKKELGTEGLSGVQSSLGDGYHTPMNQDILDKELEKVMKQQGEKTGEVYVVKLECYVAKGLVCKVPTKMNFYNLLNIPRDDSEARIKLIKENIVK